MYSIKKLIKTRQWLTLSLISVFMIYATGFVIAQNSGWLANGFAYLLSALVLIAIGILTCRELILGIKNKNDDANTGLYLPFGPALLLSALIMMLFL